MNIEQRDLKKHLFICTNLKPEGRESCGPKGADELVLNLKVRLREDDLWEKVKVTKSGCLGPCAQGISATLYPDNLLITGITLDDEDALYKLITES